MTTTENSAAGAVARLVPIPRGGLPGWCDRFLAPPGSGDFFASRAWYDTTLAHALPAEVEPLLAVCGEADALLLPLLRTAGRLSSLTTPYSLAWRPLPAPGADTVALRAAGRAFGRLLRYRPPARLEALDAAAPGLAVVLDGCGEVGGLRLHRYRNFGNWHEVLDVGLDWDRYLAARPPALRTTIGRKLARCRREMVFEAVTAPGASLEAAIAAYEDVRGRSWKPHEPHPAFDGALMRAAAAVGALRLGVLRARADGRPAAAQYWVVAGGQAALLKLAHAEDQRAASPGTALTALMIQGLLAEGGVRELDFGRGDDPYKQLWVGQRRQRIGVVLADARHPAGLLEMARQLVGRGRQRVRGWFERPKGIINTGTAA